MNFHIPIVAFLMSMALKQQQQWQTTGLFGVALPGLVLKGCYRVSPSKVVSPHGKYILTGPGVFI